MIIETSCNRFFTVRDAGPGLEHVYLGTEVKLVKGAYVPKKNAREILVRRAATRIVLNVSGTSR